MTEDMLFDDDYREFMDGRQAVRNPALGPSAASKCYRQAAYAYLGVEESDPRGPAWRADLGTLVHLGWSARIRSQFDPADREPDVRLQAEGMPRPGEADDVDYLNRVVRDVKTARHEVAESFKVKGPYQEYWSQLEVYALALRQQYGGDWDICVVVIDMLTGEIEEYRRPADPEVGLALVERIKERHAVLTEEQHLTFGRTDDEVRAAAESFPREGKGPGRGMPCDYCPWLSACWPSPTSPDGTPQSATMNAEDQASLLVFVREYQEAQALEGKAKARKEDAAVFLRGIEAVIPDPDDPTREFAIGMSGGNPKEEWDCEAMAAKLESLGHAPIMRTVLTRRSIGIRRRKRAVPRDRKAPL